MPQYSAEKRRALADEVYALSIKRVSYVEIGKRLEISRQFAATLAREEKDRLSSEREKEDARQKSISTYEKVIAYGWELLESEELKANSLNQSGVMNSITAAQRAIDEIEGSKAPTRTEQDVNVSYRDYTTGAELEDLFREIDEELAREGQGSGPAASEDGEGAPADSYEPVDTPASDW